MSTVPGTLDTFNGWSNRETWAVALHINNDQAWQNDVLTAIAEALASSTELFACEAGDIVRVNVEDMLDSLGGHGAYEVFQSVRDDLGSLWRVDWHELGATFLRDAAAVSECNGISR